jgi:hypothetical protein
MNEIRGRSQHNHLNEIEFLNTTRSLAARAVCRPNVDVQLNEEMIFSAVRRLRPDSKHPQFSRRLQVSDTGLQDK